MRNLASAFALCSLLALATAAHADPYLFDISNATFTAGAPTTYDFALPSRPTPFYASTTFGYFLLQNVEVSVNGAAPAPEDVYFYNNVAKPIGGIESDAVGLTLSGSTLFAGDPNFPTFILGTFTENGFGTQGNYVVNISDAVPEPSSLILLSTGALGLLSTLRRRIL